ncbi:hypothetical protein BP1026B_I0706 [Burkholderia pseudomallei 1026b]|uniref:Uncharacterized protein n=1 Tax=Burkholderia pseudomallei (strain 1026b) TaxID=884204 RepID=A0A0H3HKD8_BURP2|nr:hypothetical protein BP1026B_I0706 [Burkholderia pseudomallei 1026b]EIF67208.1 hypothetical protein BP1026A_0199 [Burkholderia pseudomallei 1026a]
MENVSKEVRIYSAAWKVFLSFARVAHVRCYERNRVRPGAIGWERLQSSERR